ncbi:MAG: hypothetical protein ACD_75C02430G0003 [uncultured bacterium]|nr:MAG: hypothetical protein ACD_75C02430G0003 [uncultured bacterium]
MPLLQEIAVTGQHSLDPDSIGKGEMEGRIGQGNGQEFLIGKVDKVVALVPGRDRHIQLIAGGYRRDKVNCQIVHFSRLELKGVERLHRGEVFYPGENSVPAGAPVEIDLESCQAIAAGCRTAQRLHGHIRPLFDKPIDCLARNGT